MYCVVTQYDSECVLRIMSMHRSKEVTEEKAALLACTGTIRTDRVHIDPEFEMRYTGNNVWVLENHEEVDEYEHVWVVESESNNT